jgi:hypothetical protein
VLARFLAVARLLHDAAACVAFERSTSCRVPEEAEGAFANLSRYYQHVLD